MNNQDANKQAQKVMRLLLPFCDKLSIAGSVRRQKPEVKDIEIVCLPKAVDDLCGNPTYPLLGYLNNPTDFLADECKRLKGKDRYQQWQLPNVKLDLFIVLPPAQWGVIYTLRTGPWEFSKAIVTQQRIGGLLPDEARVKDGSVWVGDQKVSTPNEEDFFKFCDLAFIHPQHRDRFVRNGF